MPWKSDKYYIFWVCVISCRYPACNVHASYNIAICGLPRSTIFFPHYLINCTIFGKKLLNIKCVFWFSLQLLCETFLIIRRTDRDMIKNVYRSSCKVSVILVRFWWKANILPRFFEKFINIIFNENPSSGSRVVPCRRTDRQTDRQTEAKMSVVAFRNRIQPQMLIDFGCWGSNSSGL